MLDNIKRGNTKLVKWKDGMPDAEWVAECTFGGIDDRYKLASKIERYTYCYQNRMEIF